MVKRSKRLNQEVNLVTDKVDPKAVLASLLTAALLVLSFPKFGHPLVAWFALTPLFYALRNATPQKAFLYGFISGIVTYAGLLYWIVYVLVKHGNTPVFVGVLALLLLSGYLALYFAIFSSCLVFLKKRGWGFFYTAPATWVALEYLKSNLLTGFPWENLGHSQHSLLPMIQIADITGVYGLSFAIVAVSVALYELTASTGKRKTVFVHCLVSSVLVLTILLYGIWRMDEVKASLASATRLPVTIVQGSMDQSIKWNPAYQAKTIQIYRSLSIENAPPKGGLIVWPETATPFHFQEVTPLSNQVIQTAQETQSWLLFGSPAYEKKAGKIHFFNSAFLVSPQGKVTARYDKVHLVPFGEYVPLRRFLPFVRRLVVGMGDFSSGPGFIPMETPGGRVGVLICYEAIFPHASSAYRNYGAELLVNITNDAWFGKTSAPHQHLSMTAFRAVETRLFVVRAANTGISAIVQPTGEVTKETPLFERTAIRSEVSYLPGNTIYALYGDFFAFACIFVTLFLILFALMRRKKI